MSDTLSFALEYIRRGWSVIPLLPRSKQPAVKIAGFLDGSHRFGEQDAQSHWRAHPDHGIAIVTGKPSGLIAIDVDVRNGGDEAAVRASLGYEPTCVVRTGGGGVHIYCAHPGGHVAKGKTSMPGVDRQADGAYCVAPPSIHPNGTEYRWE